MLFKTILLCLLSKKVIFKPPILYNFFYKSWKYARKIPGLSRILHVSGPPRESINKNKGENMKFQGIKQNILPPPLEALTSFPCMILRIITCTSGGPVSFLISNKRLCPSRHTSFLWRPVNESTLAYSPVRYLCSKSDLPETELPTMPCIEKTYICLKLDHLIMQFKSFHWLSHQGTHQVPIPCPTNMESL